MRIDAYLSKKKNLRLVTSKKEGGQGPELRPRAFDSLQATQDERLLDLCRGISDRMSIEGGCRTDEFAPVSELVSGLVQKVNSPLAGVKAALEVLSVDLDLDPDDQEVFAQIIREIIRMERIFDDMLWYALPPPMTLEQVDIHLLIRGALRQARQVADCTGEKKLQCKIDCHPNLPLVEADSAQLRQALLNIYTNAIEAIDCCGTITTSIGTTGDGMLAVRIADTGKGLEGFSVDQIFTPFHGTKNKKPGLGLPISKRLIERHGGSITVKRLRVAGTMVELMLPFLQGRRA